MSDFSSLLGSFQKNVPKLSSQQQSKKRETVGEVGTDAKKPRQIDASKDFPPVKQLLVVCPAGVQTGGPEALHQLCHQLNTNTKLPAYMVYTVSEGHAVSYSSRAKKSAVYDSYNAPPILYDPFRYHEENDEYLLVWPECWTDQMLAYLKESRFPCQCAIWWLSVDNNTGRFRQWQRKDILHLYQSEYARQHLLKNGASNLVCMTEYISSPPAPNGNPRRTIDVLFNPLKGIHYTDDIRKRSASSINFRPIGGGPHGHDRIQPSEVRELLNASKLYIDFGPHPGMDRLPREAALAGCLVVTNTEGSAHYYRDVPLPAKYKVGSFNVEEIHKLLRDLLDNYQERKSDLDDYRCWIQGQKDQMTECVEKLFDIVVMKRTKRTK